METVPLMCEKGQSLPIDRGKGEMSARCCGSSTLADIFRFLGEMGIPGTRGGFPELSGWRKSEAWCSATKKQGLTGGEAPRRPASNPDSVRGRGARRRRNKGLREVKYHANRSRAPIQSVGVVPLDEETRASGRRGTTPSGIERRFSRGAWCSTTKK